MKKIYTLLFILFCSAVYAAQPISSGTVNQVPQVITCSGADQTTQITNLINGNGSFIFKGICKTNNIVFNTGLNVKIVFAPGSILEPVAGVTWTNPLWTITNSTIDIGHFEVNGLNLIQAALDLENNNINAYDADFVASNLGSLTTVSTNLIMGIHFRNNNYVNWGSATFSNFSALGNGTCNSLNPIGGVRGFVIDGTGAITAGFTDIINYTWNAGAVAGDDGEQIDGFQVQLQTVGGHIHNMVCNYGASERRCAKFQSGVWTVDNFTANKIAGFVPVSGQQVGATTLNAFDVASGNTTVILDSVNGDFSGFPFALADSQTTGNSTLIVSNADIQGATAEQTRPSTVCNSALSNFDTLAFYNASGDVGGGISNSIIKGFGAPLGQQGNFEYAVNNQFIDPVDFVGQEGTSSSSNGLLYSGNTVTTVTNGNLNQTRMWRILNVQNVSLNDNKFIENGNTTHAARFFDFTTVTATGQAIGNSSSVTTVAPVNIAAGTPVSINLSNNAAANATFNSGQVNNTNATLAAMGSMSANLITGKTYHFKAHLIFAADAVGGHQYSMNGGAATASSIGWQTTSICNATKLVVISAPFTTLAGNPSDSTSACVAGETILEGDITVSASGTLIPQFAQAIANGTSSVKVGSSFIVTQMN